jgi:hypothetical protein
MGQPAQEFGPSNALISQNKSPQPRPELGQCNQARAANGDFGLADRYSTISFSSLLLFSRQ